LITEILPTGEALVYDYSVSASFKVSSDGSITDIDVSPFGYLVNKYASLNLLAIGDQCNYLDTAMGKCVKENILIDIASLALCLFPGKLVALLGEIENYKTVLDAIYKFMKDDVIGFYQAISPCGLGSILCATKDKDPNVQCYDTNSCNGDEYCAKGICMESTYKAQSGTECKVVNNIWPKHVPGKCNSEGQCISTCNPNGIWKVEGNPIVDQPCYVNAEWCRQPIEFEFGASVDGSNVVDLPQWSFEPSTCTGTWNGVTNRGTITFADNIITECKIFETKTGECTCERSCSGYKISYPGNCGDGICDPNLGESTASCPNDCPPPTTCTYTYSDWSACQPDNTQTRTVVSSSPAGCVVANPVLSQPCTYVPPPSTPLSLNITSATCISVPWTPENGDLKVIISGTASGPVGATIYLGWLVLRSEFCDAWKDGLDCSRTATQPSTTNWTLETAGWDGTITWNFYLVDNKFDPTQEIEQHPVVVCP